MSNFSVGAETPSAPPPPPRSYAADVVVSKRDSLKAKQHGTGVPGGGGSRAATAGVWWSVWRVVAGARRAGPLQLVLRGNGGGALDDPVIT